jgi:predicted MFS family arabinose efflux permease
VKECSPKLDLHTLRAIPASIWALGFVLLLMDISSEMIHGLLPVYLVADTAPPELRGTAFGMFNLTTGLALLVASIVAGALWDAAGPKATFLTGAAFALIALGGFVAIRRYMPENKH